ncbi:MAG: divergent polysaccharide deacetylase family protein [Paracoccaceae bacterium]
MRRDTSLRQAAPEWAAHVGTPEWQKRARTDMAESTPEPQVRDADIDGLEQTHWLGGFSRGVLLGGLGSAVALLGLTLTQPLPPHLPGVGRVEVVTPSPAVVEPEPKSERELAVVSEEQDIVAVVSPEPAQPVVQPEPVETASESEEAGQEASSAENPAPVAIAEIPSVSDEPEQVAETQSSREQPAPIEDAVSTDVETPAATEDAQQIVALAVPEAPVPDPVVGAELPTATAPETLETPEIAEPPEVEVPVVVAALAPVREISLAGPAVQVNARTFEAPVGAPLMAVVLEDPGLTGISPDALALLTMPLTFAVRPDRDDAKQLAGAARLAGHEVLAQLPLPSAGGADPIPNLFDAAQSPEDLANIAQNYLAELDVAIGATAPAGASLLNDRRAMEAILAPLAAHGFAYLDLRSGIGSVAQRISGNAGFEYAESNRYADVEATEEQIYQMLDGAAFQARRKGTAIVSVGATSAALKAVVRWGLERGGQEVWFAPLSAVIARQKED